MARTPFTAPVAGGQVAGWVEGDGPPVLLLHGGPGLSYQYLDEVAADIGAGYQIAGFQQRGIAPSMTDGPYDVDTHITDVVAVMDTLGWSTAYVVGHSWGGHLALHVAVAIPERLRGVLCVDPLGGVGDGGEALMSTEMFARLFRARRARPGTLDTPVTDEGSDQDWIESTRLFWPAYFADWDAAPPMPQLPMSAAANAGGFESLRDRLPDLERSLPTVSVPLGIVAGSSSPIPVEEAARLTAAAIPGAWVEVAGGAGHFPWVESPGCVRDALQRLVST